MSQINVANVIASIQRKVKDGSYGDELVLSMINNAILFIVNTIRPQSLVRPMVEITTITGGSPTELPDDMLFPYIIAVMDSDSLPMHFSTRMTDLDFLQSTSSPVSRKAALFGYGGIYLFPVEDRGEKIFVTYLVSPEEIPTTTSLTDSFSFGPAPFVQDAVIAYVCREIYGEIEDGIDGRKVNTDKYHALLLSNMSAISQAVGQASLAARPEVIGFSAFEATGMTNEFGVL